jgi:rhamnogalacturonyl hydrolase YesR
MNNLKTKIENSIKNLEKWVEEHDYKGFEPFDGLSSYLRPLTFNNPFAERILQQAVRQSPINLRPLLGIKPQESTKGRAYMVSGYLKMWQLTHNEEYRTKAINCLDWLIKNKSPNYSNFSWGNDFDYSSRVFRLPKHEPTIVWTSLIGQSFINAFEILGDEKYLGVAASITEWIMGLPREQTNSGTCISYVAFSQKSIHNANMLGAAMLARTAKYIQNKAAIELAKQAMAYSCNSQLPSGAWYYGEEAKYHWIDNFHTGYNLDSLKCYIENTNDTYFEKQLLNGFEYFKMTFFEDSGWPNYYDDRRYPIDIQCASQAIETLVNFSDHDPSGLKLAQKVVDWTIENMQDKSGYFYYRILPLKKVKIPMIHWGQNTMYKAMVSLLSKLSNHV